MLERIGAALIITIAVACGADNVEACKDYVSAYNDLPCVPEDERLGEAEYCPDSLDGDCEFTSYYDCLSSAFVCVDGVVDGSGTAGCTIPSC